MFDILVYLYETYYRPDACPEPAALAKKLSAVGFDDVEISEALVWLNDLTAMAGVEHTLTAASTGTRSRLASSPNKPVATKSSGAKIGGPYITL